MTTARTEIKLFLKKLKNDIIFAAARLAIVFFRILPFRLSRFLLRLLGATGYYFMPSMRRLMLEHLRICFGNGMGEREMRGIARASLANLGASAAEIINIERIDLRELVDVPDAALQSFDDALSAGKGVVFVSAHLGNWELFCHRFGKAGYKINVVAKESYDPRFSRMIERFRRGAGVRTIWRGSGNTAREMLAALHRGEILAMLIDQDTKVPGVFVEFFGRPCRTPKAAAAFALSSGAPLLTGFIHRDDGRHSVGISRFKLVETGDREADILANTAALTRLIETEVSRRPEEWVWMHRRWKTRPPEEPSKKEEAGEDFNGDADPCGQGPRG